MADPIRVRAVVSGHVQGVFFRDSVRRKAEREGVAGWIRNQADGSVEAVFEGAPAAVERLVSYCHEGPRGASVARVDRFDEQVEGAQGFCVR